VVDSVATLDVDVIVTHGARGIVDLGRDRSRVHPVGFVPLAELVGDVEVVVTAGGTGTVLAALSAGLPMVVMPVVANQPWNAARAAALGAAVVVSEPQKIGAAVQRVLAEPFYRTAAVALADQMSRIAGAEEVSAVLLDKAATAAKHADPHADRAKHSRSDR
jgi:UDP:flavonoid glycosyltransferase YjiC (YdhE family)